MRKFLQLALDFLEAPVMRSAPETLADESVQFQHPRTNRYTRLSHARVGYEFKRSKRRTIGMMVGADGLVVRAPNWVPLYEVEAALQEKSDWIVRKLDEARQRQQQLASNRIEWQHGARFSYLGQDVTMHLDPARHRESAGACLQSDDTGLLLVLGLPQTASLEQIRDLVQAWLMQQARQLFAQRLDHFASQLQVRWTKLALSSAGTRWGSARHDGSIRLNWRLIHFNMSVIDYVVAHELSHLRHMDHGPKFWDTVRSVVPDYQIQRSQLKDDALPIWQEP